MKATARTKSRNGEETILLEGTIVEALKGARFLIKLDNGHRLRGHLSGKMRRFRIRVLPGDRVTVEISPYDVSQGRIVHRGR